MILAPSIYLLQSFEGYTPKITVTSVFLWSEFSSYQCMVRGPALIWPSGFERNKKTPNFNSMTPCKLDFDVSTFYTFVCWSHTLNKSIQYNISVIIILAKVPTFSSPLTKEHSRVCSLDAFLCQSGALHRAVRHLQCQLVLRVDALRLQVVDPKQSGVILVNPVW